jgi:CHAD domain-containing protein
MTRVKKLMKANATVRDWDIVLSKLSTHKKHKTYDNLIENLRKLRKSNLEEARELALSVQKSAGLRAKSRDISNSSLQKRYEKIVKKLATKISNELPIVREDASKIQELHIVRRDCKQLRYILEMSEFSTPPKPLVELRSWQDLLGTIRDHDVMIEYLTRLRESPQIRLALNIELENREKNYLKFVEASRDNPLSDLAKSE